ncbi:MAG: HNH endonuclease signature motif containing protein [Solirubrobacteraceae bacterium]
MLLRAGYRCEYGKGAGDRCTATTGLEAHHRVDLVAGGSNDPKADGVALCRRHHRAA